MTGLLLCLCRIFFRRFATDCRDLPSRRVYHFDMQLVEPLLTSARPSSKKMDPSSPPVLSVISYIAKSWYALQGLKKKRSKKWCNSRIRRTPDLTVPNNRKNITRREVASLVQKCLERLVLGRWPFVARHEGC